MKKINIMLVCGSGSSSGFVAQAIRKAMKKVEIGGEVFARGHTELTDYIETIDALLIGPHFGGLLDNTVMMNRLTDRNITVMVMDKNKYSIMDGKGILDDLIKKMMEEDKL